MSAGDVSPDEMGRNRHDEGDELERLLEGSADAREQFAELAIFVDDVHAMPAPSPGAEQLHVAAMMSEASQLLADKGDPVVRPVSKAHGPAPQASGLPMRRGTPMVKVLLAKVMAPLLAVFTVMGGLAYAQALPDPLQDAVVGAGGVVGFDLPHSDDDEIVDSDEGAVDDEDSDTKDEIDVDEDVDDEVDENTDEGEHGGGGSGNDDAQGDDDHSGSGGGSDSGGGSSDDQGDADEDEADEGDDADEDESDEDEDEDESDGGGDSDGGGSDDSDDHDEDQGDDD